MKNKKGVLILIVILLFFMLYVPSKNRCRMTEHTVVGTVESVGFQYYKNIDLYNVKFAILDSSVSKNYEFVHVYDMNNQENDNLATSETHADKMIEILHNLLPNLEIDLYIVADEKGIVNKERFQWALQHITTSRIKYDLINMSLYVEKDRDISSLLKELYLNDTILVAAAGNMGEDEQVYPASLDFVIGVGGISELGELANMSNYGDVEYYMPIKYRGTDANYEGTSVSAVLFSAALLIVKHEGDFDSSEQLMEYVDTICHNPKIDPTLGKGQVVLADILKGSL